MLPLFGLADISSLQAQQLLAILHALSGHHILLSLRTGAGKSLCYQLPAVIASRHQQNITIVIEPQLAIIQSQMGSLGRYPGPTTVQDLSGLNTSHAINQLHRLRDGYRSDPVYTTSNTFFGAGFGNLFKRVYESGAIACIALDEVHGVRRSASVKLVLLLSSNYHCL